MSHASAITGAAARLGPFGLYLFAFSAVWKTAPAFIGVGLALLQALTSFCQGRRRAWDTVEIVAAALALWLALRGGLQMLGFGDPALFHGTYGFVDWLMPLAFAPLATLQTATPLKRTAALWACAAAGFTLGVVEFLYMRGIDVLWSGERLGYHLNRPLGIGLYAGCFVIVLAALWRHWWNVPTWRWPVRIAAIAGIVLYLEVLVTAQNRSTFVGLTAVLGLAILHAGWTMLRGRGGPLGRAWPAALVALVVGVAVVGLNRDTVEQRLGAEREVLSSVEEGGLQGAPASSITARLRMWQYALRGIADAPLIGHGFGRLERVMERDLNVREAFPAQKGFDHLHNSYLQTLWSQGLIGAALWTLLVAALLRDLVRAARRDRRVRAALPAVVGTICFIAVWAFFDHRLSHPDMQFFTILSLLSLRLLGRADDASGAPLAPNPTQ